MTEKWIVPCNIKYFNIIEHFKTHETAVWKNSFTIHTGDIIYIYIGAPYSEIKYKCIVVSDAVDENKLNENSYAIVQKPSKNYFSKKIKYIEFKIEKEYPDGTFKLEELKRNGLGQVQIQARTDRRIQAFIDSVDTEDVG